MLDLRGCTPEPLMGYLKSLGVLRLVAEQADLNASISWSGGACRLDSTLDRDSLLAFFLGSYRPTPVLAPWNGGSGFFGGGSEPLEAIAGSTCERLALYRETIASVRAFCPLEKPKDEQKQQLLVNCRARLPDQVVPWLDSCFVLGDAGPNYFPLLGTGANDGRLDFTNNFMQRLHDVIPFSDETPPKVSQGWLVSALFAESIEPLRKTAIGQFNPGAIGGANGIQGKFEADSRVNPWDFVLMIEGAILFAGSVARRLSTNTAQRAVFPFAVESVAVGYGSASASEETNDGSRAELWLPLWEPPATLAEIGYLFSEGRAQLGRRQASNAVEFALAISLLGVSRGISSFTRYGFLKRNGLSYLATPIGRVPVSPRPRARLLDEPPLATWLHRLRIACRDKEKTPARYQSILRQIDTAIYNFAVRSSSSNTADRQALIQVLRALGQAEQTLAVGLTFCKNSGLRPLQGLSPQWLEQADDSSPEFRLAATIAAIGRRRGNPIRPFLEEVEMKGDYANWCPGSTSCVWSRRPLAANLATVFRRRQMEEFRAGGQEASAAPLHPASLDDIVAFLRGETDDDKLSDLTWGLLAIDWPEVPPAWLSSRGTAVPPEFALPRLLVEPRTFIATLDGWEVDASDKPNVKPDQEVFHILASGDQKEVVARCVDLAARRLKSLGLIAHGMRNRRQSRRPLAIVSPIPADRLLAAMLFPLSNHDLGFIADKVLHLPETEE